MVARDRAQLILIGAIALAFIILGLVVVLNGVLFTQTISSGNDVEEVGNAETSALEIRRGVSGLTQAVNVGANESDKDDLEEAIEANLSSFQGNYSNVTSASQAQLTNMSVTNIEYGSLIHQSTEGALTNESDEPNWDAYNGSGRELNGFVLTINNSTFTGPLTIELDNGTSTRTIEFSDGGDTVNVGGDWNCEIATRSDATVEIDLVSGRVIGNRGHDCDPLQLGDGTAEEIDRLSFENGDGVNGTYEIVFAGTTDTGLDRTPRSAALTVEVNYQFEAESVSYERTMEVDVYGGST